MTLLQPLTLGSLFDGIGGWLVAAEHAGINPIWRAEIDPFPLAVSEYHFPKVISYGDVCQIHGNAIPPVDIICAGSPCQNLSLAGNRKGLHGSESSLFYESIRIFYEMREKTHGKQPRFFVWENVPGAFSSNHGHDFQSVLQEITKSSIPMPKSLKWATAGMVRSQQCDLSWRVLDAQYFGVPQRRRRIFLVADFAAQGRCAEQILFVEKGVRRNPETRGRQGKTTSTVSQGSPAAPDPPSCPDADCPVVKSFFLSVKGGNDKTRSYTICSKRSNGMNNPNPYTGCVYETKQTRTLDCNGSNPTCNQGGTIVLSSRNMFGECHPSECGASLRAGKDGRENFVIENKRIIGTLAARDYKGVGNEYVSEGKLVTYPYSKCSPQCGALCARDYKGPGNNHSIADGKLVITDE